MAATSHDLHSAGAKGKRTATLREYEATYRVHTDSLSDGPQVVLDYATANLPNPYDATSYAYGNDVDTLAVCTEISYQGRDPRHGMVHEVVCKFSTDDSNSTGQGIDRNGDPTTNPLDFRPEFRSGYSLVSRPVVMAKYRGGFTGGVAAAINDGDEMPPMSSAFGVFDPPLEGEVPIQKLTIAVNVNNFNQADANGYVCTVNQQAVKLKPMAFLGYPTLTWQYQIPARLGKIQDYRPSIRRETVTISGIQQKLDYIHLEVDILIDPSGWRKFIADVDWHRNVRGGDPNGRGGAINDYERVMGQAFDEPIRGPSGDPVIRKVFLDGNGQPKHVQQAQHAVMLQWQIFPEKNWTAEPILSTILENA